MFSPIVERFPAEGGPSRYQYADPIPPNIVSLCGLESRAPLSIYTSDTNNVVQVMVEKRPIWADGIVDGVSCRMDIITLPRDDKRSFQRDTSTRDDVIPHIEIQKHEVRLELKTINLEEMKIERRFPSGHAEINDFASGFFPL